MSESTQYTHIIRTGYLIFFSTLTFFASTQLHAREIDSTLAQWTPWNDSADGLCLAKPLYCGCNGYFKAPTASIELEEKPSSSTGFYGVADEYSYSFDGIAELLGNVVIQIDDLQVNAEQMSLNDQEQTADFSGNVQLTLPGFRLSGPAAEISTAEQSAIIHNAGLIFYDSGLRGFADKVELNGNKGLNIKNGELTSCTPGHESWMLAGQEIDLDIKKGWGTIRHMRIKVGHIPLVYIPYFTFPLNDQRKSGFLVPKLDIAEPDFSMPFYWNIAPNYDATLTPRFIGSRGSMLETELRYLKPAYKGTFNVDTLPNDDLRKNANLKSRRAHLEWDHHGDIAAGWDYSIDINYVSDPDYFADFGNSLNSQTQSFLNRALNIRYISPNWSFHTQFQAYQVLDDTLDDEDYPYRRSPEIQLNHFDRLTNNLPLFWDNRFSYTYFEQPKAIVPYAHRASWRSILSAPLPFIWGQIEPKFELHHRRYYFEDSAIQDRQYEFTIPTLSLDIKGSGRKNNIQNRYWQTLEPRLFLTHTPSKDQSEIPLFDTSELTLDYDQLFLSNPFIGGDQIADRQQISVGLTSRLFEEDTGRLILRGDIGQGFIDGDHTPIITRLVLSPQDRLYWTNQINWQDDRDGLYSASSRISYYRPRPTFLSTDALSLEYRYRQNDSMLELEGINQYEISFAHTLNHNVKLLGKVRYDNREDRTFEHLTGFTYTGCCWEASLVYHRLIESDELSSTALDAEHSILFEFSLKSLGGLGGGLQSFLKEQIPGFQPRGDIHSLNTNSTYN